MALTIELTLAIASTRTSYTVTDATTYGTGGNPERSAVACFLNAYKMNYSNEATELTVSPDDDDPETDSVWTVTASDEDGWNKIYFVIIPDFNSSSTYAQYDAVFNPSDDKVYRSRLANNTQDTLTNTTWWEEITDPATLANNKDTSTESENITSVVYQRVLRANSQYEFASRLSNQSKFVDDDELDTLQDYNVFALMLDAAEVADSRTEVLDGEQLCRRIQSKFIDAN